MNRVVVRDRFGREVRDITPPDPVQWRDHPIHQFMVDTATVHHSDPGAVDEYGDHPIAVQTSTDQRCYIWQSTRGETDEVEHERWQMAFRPDTIIDANDSVEVRGMTLQVHGNPWPVVDPVTGWTTHIECTGRRHR